MILRQSPPSLRRRHRRSLRSGVTLLDLLLVVVIASILAVVGIPSMTSSLIDFRLSTTATRIIAAVEYAQASAVANGCSTRVRFDVAGDSVVVRMAVASVDLANQGTTEFAESDIETVTFRRMEDPLNRDSDYVLTLGDQGWSGNVGLLSADFGGDGRIEFDERGTPASGGTVTLESDGQTLLLSVDAQSGKVTIP